MRKLKTLKDLPKVSIDIEKLSREYVSKSLNVGIDEDILKQEAIKRAKYYISLLAGAKFECISYGTPFFKDVKTYDDMNFIGRIVEIVEFNNLTEEDLK